MALRGHWPPWAVLGAAGAQWMLSGSKTLLLPIERRLTPGLEVFSVNQLFNHLLSLKKEPLLTLLEISFVFSL